MAAEKWNVRTIASTEDTELFATVFAWIDPIEGSKINQDGKATGGLTPEDSWLFNADQLRDMYKCAVRYACTYPEDGGLDWMWKMKNKALRSLPSDREMWGILNCMRGSFRYQARKQQREATPAPSPTLGNESPSVGKRTSTQVDSPVDATPALPFGYYTVDLGDGTHVTLRLKKDFRDDAPESSRMIGYLSGPNNESMYTNFGCIDGTKTWYWKSKPVTERIRAAVDILIGADTEQARGFGMAYAMASGRCARCGKTLTVPASIHAGLGPDCAERGWF